MKALTIRQPWAWAILWAGKDVENRTWLPSPEQLKPGERFAIHAALKPVDNWDEALTMIRIAREYRRALPLPRWEDSPRGAIVGTAVLIELRDKDPAFSSWAAPGAKHWSLFYVRPIQPPLPCPGKQGLWTIPTKIFEAIPPGAR